MIEYDNYNFEMQMTCDGALCYKELEISGDWSECIQEAKDNGWKVRDEDGEWKHYCPKCWTNLRAKDAFDKGEEEF